jgi:hypothetical protein
VDLDGFGTGTTAISEIQVRDAGGANLITSLSGVLASLSISGGNVTTNSGEFRRALGSAGGGCANHIRWNGGQIACGTLTVGRLLVTGSVIETPVPAAAWLLGSGIAALGWLGRRSRSAP